MNGFQSAFCAFARNSLVVVLCFMMSGLLNVAFAGNDAPGAQVGQVTGLTSVASSDRIALQAKESVRVGEQLSTDRTGRLRLQLQDGSVLNLGPESLVKVTKHDVSTGATTLYLATGQLRCRVAKQHAAGNFQVITPESRISVVGTDFYVTATANRTQVIAYTGIVSVGAGVKGSMVDVAAGQYVIVDRSGISRLQLTPEDLEQETIAATALPGEIPQVPTEASAQTPRSHGRRNLLIAVGIAAGAIAGVVAARGGGSQPQNSTPPPSSVPPIPAH